jgi:hypothetical protein
LGKFLKGLFLGSNIPIHFQRKRFCTIPFKAADLPLPLKSVTCMREGNGLFLVPSEREDIRARTNEIPDTYGTIAVVYAKDTS